MTSRTAGGQYRTGAGISIVNVYDGSDDERTSCYSCNRCIEKRCSVTGLSIPDLGKNAWQNCRYFMTSSRYYENRERELEELNTARERENRTWKSQSAISNTGQKRDYRKGQTVLHREFGKGVISEVNRNGKEVRIVVEFSESWFDCRRFDLNYLLQNDLIRLL